MAATKKKVSHTPGPWKFTVDKREGMISIHLIYNKYGDELADYLDDERGENSICGIWGGISDRKQADAKLISASPELLAVLKKVNRAIQSSNMKGTILHSKIKEAIKKATE